MILLQAPLPLLSTTVALPNPQFNDSEAVRQTMQMQRAMDGTRYTYLKTGGRSKLQYTFDVTRVKALELRAFVDAFHRAKIRLTNHKAEVWEGYIVTNPTEFTTQERTAGSLGGATVEVVLEFEGLRIS